MKVLLRAPAGVAGGELSATSAAEQPPPTGRCPAASGGSFSHICNMNIVYKTFTFILIAYNIITL